MVNGRSTYVVGQLMKVRIKAQLRQCGGVAMHHLKLKKCMIPIMILVAVVVTVALMVIHAIVMIVCYAIQHVILIKKGLCFAFHNIVYGV